MGSARFWVYKHTVLCHVEIYATELIYVFLMYHLWVEIREQVRVQPFCEVCETNGHNRRERNISFYQMHTIVLYRIYCLKARQPYDSLVLRLHLTLIVSFVAALV